MATAAFSARRDGVDAPVVHVPPVRGRAGVALASDAEAPADTAAVLSGSADAGAVVGESPQAATAIARVIAVATGRWSIAQNYPRSLPLVQSATRVGYPYGADGTRHVFVCAACPRSLDRPGSRLERPPPLADLRDLVRRDDRAFRRQPRGRRDQLGRGRLEQRALEIRGW